MKVKEIPKSLLTALGLLSTPIEKLGEGAVSVEGCVVSLTSIPSRIKRIHLTIRSLLSQTLAPEKIVLWVHESLQDQIPEKLRKLEGSRFAIHYSSKRSAHRKLVETMRLYPHSSIVTCDDDMMYPADWLQRLWRDHLAFPGVIIGHECRTICYAENGELLPYQKWVSESPGRGTARTLAVGYGGVVYPPNCMHADVVTHSLYDQLAPKADDLWFKAMSTRLGTKTQRCSDPRPKPTPICMSQRSSLKRYNVRGDGNRKQWQLLVDYYQLNI